jgi:alanyl-tRNA synthetase
MGSNLVGVLVGVNEGKGNILVVSGADAVKAGVHAGKLVKAVCTLTGASGGGRPDSAMGGVGDLSKVDAALAQAAELVAGMHK